MACHARAQNMGQKAAEMLRLVPQASVKVIERCSGHGGSWGFKQEFFEVGMKVGRPVARQAAQNGAGFVMSECPLAGVHIQQGIERLGGDGPKPELVTHPIQILARAYEGTA
jgi:glycerol-3-phosphate dehydrogenase subunit C